jgi:molybdate transport system substrate-binding protein
MIRRAFVPVKFPAVTRYRVLGSSILSGFHDSLSPEKNGQGRPQKGEAVRFAIAAIFVLGLSVPALAEQVNLLSPPMITNAGLKEINARYTGKTGVTFNIAGTEITKLADAIKTTRPPPDIIFMPTDMMTKLEASGGVRPGERVHLGRMQIGLAVAKGAPHPDISTVAKLAAVLKSAKMVVYTNPANGSLQARMIDTLLNRSEFAGVHKQVSSKGNGISALARGDGDMALQLICEILDRPETELVGPLPAQLNASIDADAAVLTGAPHPKEAAAYLKHITQPDAVAIWASKGLVRQ